MIIGHLFLCFSIVYLLWWHVCSSSFIHNFHTIIGYFFLLLNFEGSLTYMWFTNIYHSLYSLSCHSLNSVKIIILMKFNLSICSFIDCAFLVLSLIITLATQGCRGYYLFFSSKGFIILGFAFRSMIHFEVIFVYSVRYEMYFEVLLFFFFCIWVSNCSTIIFWKRFFYFHRITFVPLLKISCPCGYICFWTFILF